MPVLKRDTQYHTYADYLEWSRSYGDELVDGTTWVREPPSPTYSHQEIIGELYLQIATALKNSPCRVCIAPLDVRLPKGNEEDGLVDTVVQPDLMIVCDRQKIDERGVRGAPDWLAEVLSPSTAKHDQVVKVPAYERAGVREVWLIHPKNRKLTLYRLEGGSHGPPTVLPLAGQTPISAVPGVTIDWDSILAKRS